MATAWWRHERELVRVPGRGSTTQAAAATPEAFLTAFDAIVLQAGLGVGRHPARERRAAAAWARRRSRSGRRLGARVVANVRTEGLRPRVAELGAEALAPTRRSRTSRELGGADVILELVGGPHMAGNMAALARGRPADDRRRRQARRRGARSSCAT